MKQIILDVIHLNNDYTGNGMYMGLYFCALLFFGFYYKKSKFTDTLLKPMVLLVVAVYFAFPVLNCFYQVDSDITARAFWVLMTPVVVALFGACFLEGIKDSRKQTLALLLLVPVIFFCGVFKFSNAMYEPSENIYKLPQDVLNICDYVLSERSSDTEDVNIVVPYEIAHVPRQYSSYINMLFGENATYGRIAYEWDENKVKACDEMITAVPDLNFVNEVARENNMQYIVFNSVYHEFGNTSVNQKGYTEDVNFVGDRTPNITDDNLLKIGTKSADDGNIYWNLADYNLEYVDTFGQYLLYRYI